jgi:hypothetical protein
MNRSTVSLRAGGKPLALPGSSTLAPAPALGWRCSVRFIDGPSDQPVGHSEGSSTPSPSSSQRAIMDGSSSAEVTNPSSFLSQ